VRSWFGIRITGGEQQLRLMRAQCSESLHAHHFASFSSARDSDFNVSLS
jgi:hypothetical protein